MTVKTKIVSFKDIANHPNFSLSPKDYINSLPKWKRWMNNKMGYREDYDKITVWKFIKELSRRYFVHYYHYHNNRPTIKQKCEPRGGYRSEWVTVPAPGKKSYETFDITFFWFTPFAFKFTFEWHNSIFFNCSFKFSILKPNLQLKIGFSRNTA